MPIEIELDQEPRGEAYEQILRWMQVRFTEGLLVHRLEDVLEQEGDQFLAVPLVLSCFPAEWQPQ